MQMKAWLALLFAAVLGAFSVYFAPMLGVALVSLAGADDPPDYPVIETLYSLAIFGSLLAIALIGGKLTGVQPLRLGQRLVRMAALGASLGVGGVAAATAYAALAGSLAEGESAPAGVALFLWGTLAILFQAAIEEIYFRGWLQRLLGTAWGTWPAILTSTLLFALMHLLSQAQTLTAVINLFLGGLLFGMLAARGGGIAGSVAAHFGWNWTERMIFGLSPNPGNGSFSSLIDFDLIGAAMWGGSAEGLNASLAMSFALIALLVPLLLLWRPIAPSYSVASG